MDIAWIGHAAFRLRGREAAVVMDPAPGSTGFRLNRPQADVVTVSNDAPEHSWVDGVAGDFQRLDGPGEYEIRNVLVTGVTTRGPSAGGPAANGAERNVAFVVTIDEVIVAHLGDMTAPPTGPALDELNRADVLLVPIGGHGHMTVDVATDVISLLEPKLVIPMLYKAGAETADLDPVDAFLRATGATLPDTPDNHINITRRDLTEATTFVILSPRGGAD